MEISSYEAELKTCLLDATIQQIILFNVFTCESMFLAYEVFSDKTGWGDCIILNKIISLQYDIVLTGKLDEKEVKSLKKALYENSPDTDEFDDVLASYALDTCSAFDEAVNFLIENEIQSSVNVALTALSMVDMFVQEKSNLAPNNTRLEDIISKDEFMMKEFIRQRFSLNELKTIKNNWTKEIVESLRSRYCDSVINLKLLK